MLHLNINVNVSLSIVLLNLYLDRNFPNVRFLHRYYLHDIYDYVIYPSYICDISLIFFSSLIEVEIIHFLSGDLFNIILNQEFRHIRIVKFYKN